MKVWSHLTLKERPEVKCDRLIPYKDFKISMCWQYTPDCHNHSFSDHDPTLHAYRSHKKVWPIKFNDDLMTVQIHPKHGLLGSNNILNLLWVDFDSCLIQAELVCACVSAHCDQHLKNKNPSLLALTQCDINPLSLQIVPETWHLLNTNMTADDYMAVSQHITDYVKSSYLWFS